MFYRKQNFFLILSVIVTIICFFIVIWKKIDPDNGFTYYFYPWELVELNNVKEEINLIYFPYMGIGMLGLFNILLSLYTLMWNDRLFTQKKFTIMLIIIDCTQLLFSFLFVRDFNKIWLSYINGQWGFGIIFIIINTILHLLSFIFIQNDIKLLRSSKHFR